MKGKTKMAKNFKTIIEIVDAERLPLSLYGNPKRKLWFRWQEGEEVDTGKTATNACCGYLEYRKGKRFSVTMHRTSTGTYIIDYATELRD